MKAYSYIRWSTPGQGDGDSLRRQTEKAVSWAKKHGVALDNSSYQDHGISAFKGKNLSEGKLGTFIKAVDDGDIETPCYLLVEELDRISRDNILESQHLLTSMIRKDINIVVLKGDGVELSKDTLKGTNGMMLMFGALLSLALANEESEKKSGRLVSAFDSNREKQKQGIITTRYCPSWLKVNADKSGWEVDKKKVATIKRIFKLSLAGNGWQVIAQMLNKDKVPLIGPRAADGWKPGNVAGILRQPAVAGKLIHRETGKVINETYYPVIVQPKDWAACQSSIDGRRNSGGFGQGTSNLFSHLSRCAYCGSNLKFTTGSKGVHYLYCLKAMTHLCDAKMIRYEPIESDVLSYLINWMHRDINAAELDQSNRSRKQELQHEITAKQAEVIKLSNALRTSRTKPEVLVDMVDAAQDDLDAAQKELAELNVNPRSAQSIEDSVEIFYKLTAGEGTQELRLKVQTALRGQISKILIAPYLNLHPKCLRDFGITDKPKDTLHMMKLLYKDGAVGITDVIIADRRSPPRRS